MKGIILFLLMSLYVFSYDIEEKNSLILNTDGKYYIRDAENPYTGFGIFDNEEKAQEAYKHFLKEKRGVLSDCAACERDMQVRYLLVTGRMNEAEEAAHDLFSGKLHCEEVPNVTYGQFLRSCNQLIADGNTEVLEKASAYCREIRASVVREKIGTGYIGYILLYYSLTDTAKALPFYKKYWHYFEKNKIPPRMTVENKKYKLMP